MSPRLDAMRTVHTYALHCHLNEKYPSVKNPEELSKAFTLVGEAIADALIAENTSFGVTSLAMTVLKETVNGTHTRLFLETSTAHVSAETAQLLNYACMTPPKSPITAHSHGPGFGWWVVVPSKSHATKEQYPEDLCALLDLARSRSCDWLLLDRDADQLFDFEVFDW